MKKISIKKISVKHIGIAGAIIALLIISAFHHCGSDKTMVVDFQRLWREVKVYQAVSESYVAYQQGIKIKFNESVLNLQKQNQDLLAEKKKLSEAEFKKKASDLSQKAQAMEQEYATLSKKGATDTNQVLSQIKPQVDKVIQKVARSKGIGLLLNKDLAVYVGEAQDVTDEIIKALNKELSPANIVVPNKDEKENKNG